MNYPRLAAYSGVKSNGAPLLNPDFTVNVDMCVKYARYGLVCVDMNSMLLQPKLAAALRSARSTVRIVGYNLTTHRWLPPSFVAQPSDKSLDAELHRLLQRTNGFLVQPPGVTGYEVDWSNKAVASGWTELMCSVVATGLIDDVFLDYCAPEVAWVPIGDADSDRVRVEHMKVLVQRIRATGGTNMKVYGNGTGAQKLSLDGTMVEGFPGPVGPWDKALAQKPGDWLKSEGQKGTLGDPRMARLTLGTACLTGAYATHGTSHYVETPYDGTWWFPEYAVDPNGAPDPTGTFVGWLGEEMGAAINLGTGLWMRTFAHGCVLVNPTASAITKDFLHPTYKRIGAPSTAERTFTVGGGDALFLRR